MATRSVVFATVALMSLPLMATAQTAMPIGEATERPALSRETSGPHSGRESSQAALRLLRTPVDKVEWLDSPMEEVVDWLRDKGEGRVNVIPRWGQLNVEGVDRDTLVTLQINNTTVAQVLNEVLEHISPDGEVRYQAMGNTLRISTKADFDRKMFLKVYDVTDILFIVPNFGRTAPNIDLQRTNTGGGGGGGGGGQSVFQGGSGGSQEESGQQTEQEFEKKLQDLRKIIEETVEPNSWDTATTGGRGRIRVFNRSLIVYNTIEVHEKIAGRFFLGE